MSSYSKLVIVTFLFAVSPPVWSDVIPKASTASQEGAIPTQSGQTTDGAPSDAEQKSNFATAALKTIADKDLQIYKLQKQIADQDKVINDLRRKINLPSEKAGNSAASPPTAYFQRAPEAQQVKMSCYYRFVFDQGMWNKSRKPIMYWTNTQNKKSALRHLNSSMDGKVDAQAFCDVLNEIGVPAMVEENTVYIEQKNMVTLVGNAPITPEPEVVYKIIPR